MAWITPTDRIDHPCFTPSKEAAEKEHRRPGQYWRCLTCGCLWLYRGFDWVIPWRRVTNPYTYWRFRKKGWEPK